IAPQANITLGEAANNSNANLYGAVKYAVNQGAHIVSMSWGGGDSSGESSYDSYFQHSGVTFLASAGDTGGQVIYPSASPYVVSVGGATLKVSSDGTYQSESAWGDGGGGGRRYEAGPGHQAKYLPPLPGQRSRDGR